MRADIPMLLFVYRHFTKYKIFIHTKLIVVFCCSHICCCALIYSHLTSPKKAKKSAFKHVTKPQRFFVGCHISVVTIVVLVPSCVVLVPDHLKKSLSGTVTKLLLWGTSPYLEKQLSNTFTKLILMLFVIFPKI